MNKVHFNSKYHNILAKEFLYREYIINKKSTYQIAKELKCSNVTIWKYLKKYNIIVRTVIETNQADPKISNILTKEFLIQEYIENKKSIQTIAKEIGCGHDLIHKGLIRYGIPRRTLSELSKGSNNPNYRHGKGICQQCGKELSDYNYKLCRKCYELNKAINISKEQLIELYINQKLSMAKIAKIFNCNFVTIFNRLHYYNIKTRSKTENYSGINHPSYIEGLIRVYPIGWSKILKASIRKRDRYVCQICGKTQRQNGRALDVHHIDYIKENLNPSNLISLCRICHGETNGNRDIYTEYFKILQQKELKELSVI